MDSYKPTLCSLINSLTCRKFVQFNFNKTNSTNKLRNVFYQKLEILCEFAFMNKNTSNRKNQIFSSTEFLREIITNLFSIYELLRVHIFNIKEKKNFWVDIINFSKNNFNYLVYNLLKTIVHVLGHHVAPPIPYLSSKISSKFLNTIAWLEYCNIGFNNS